MRTTNIIFASFLFAAAALANPVPPSPIAQTALTIDSVGDGSHAAVTFTLPDGWHIYWQNPGDSGLAPAVKFTLPTGVQAGDILWPTPQKFLTGTIVNYGYGDQVILPVPLSVSDANARGEVTVEATWLVCKDVCIPESATLRGSIPSQDNNGVIQAARAALPTPLAGSASFYADTKKVTVAISLRATQEGNIEFFPIENGVIANDGAREVSRDGNRILLTFDRGYAELPRTLNGVIKIGEHGFIFAADQSITPLAGSTVTSSFVVILLLAFAGGLLLNLMPCVLPILSLKALALAKKGGAAHAQARTQGLAYTAGVVGAFIAVAAVMLAIKSLGMAAGWGFQLQQPGFVAALTLLMVLVALNLLGLFELPVLLGNVSTRVKEDSRMGSVFTGILAVALATPCTAPFMAPAIGATLTMPPAAALTVFAALGLGMASPFLLISFWPAALRLLPKPGAWMHRFKQWVALPILITAGWLLWVLFHLNGIHGAALTLIGAIALYECIRFMSTKRWSGTRLALGILAISAATIVFQPPGFNTTEQTPVASVAYDPSELQRLRNAGTPVFVDATAAWCITCKFNERLVLHTDKIRQVFRDNDVTFMVADWTRGDPIITEYLASFGRNGVPLYVYYPPHKEPVVLPQLLTISTVRETITTP